MKDLKHKQSVIPKVFRKHLYTNADTSAILSRLEDTEQSVPFG